MKTKRLICLMLCALFTASLALPAAAASDAAAEYTIPRTPEFIAGDVDCSGSIDSGDARLALRMAVGLEQTLYHFGYRRLADVTGDNEVTSADARAILRIAVKLEPDPRVPADDGIYQLRASWFNRDSDQLGVLQPLQCNADKKTFYQSEDLPCWRIGSEQGMAEWIAAFIQEDMKLPKYNAAGDTDIPGDGEILSFLHRYRQTFFETYDLFICYFEQGSGSYRQAVYPPVVQNGVLTLPVGSAYYSDSAATDDMAYRFLFVPIQKEMTKDCASFACKRAETLWLELDADIGAYYN